MDLWLTDQWKIPAEELRLSFARSRGPGGQNVQKVASKAILHFDVLHSPSLPPDVRDRFAQAFASRLTKQGEVVLHCDQYRDQRRNVAACYQRLRNMLHAVLHPPRKRRPTRPTAGSRARRLKEKKARSQTKAHRRYRGETS
jgi:ribosome-associated protein